MSEYEYDSEKKDLYWRIAGLENKLEKLLKAFEIIKEKKVDVNDLLNFVSLKAYNDYVCACDDNDKRKLTKQQYELLKELLL